MKSCSSYSTALWTFSVIFASSVGFFGCESQFGKKIGKLNHRVHEGTLSNATEGTNSVSSSVTLCVLCGLVLRLVPFLTHDERCIESQFGKKIEKLNHRVHEGTLSNATEGTNSVFFLSDTLRPLWLVLRLVRFLTHDERCMSRNLYALDFQHDQTPLQGRVHDLGGGRDV
jgi:hypothetical protein